jgi:drug/metabolite transporter (DMT)-like permease
MSPILLILTAVVAWASSFILVKVGLKEIPPVTMAALRFFIGSIIFLAILYSRYRPGEVSAYLRKNLKMLSALGLVGIFLPNIFQNVGMQYTTASASSVLQTTSPVFTAALAALFLKESLGMRKAGGVALALTGAAMIATNGDLSSLMEITDYVYGNFLMLLSAICYAFYIILSKIGLRDGEPLIIVSLSTAIGSIFLLIFTPFVEPINALINLSSYMWGIILALAVVPTVIGFLFWFEALKRMDASKASFFIFLIPVFTVIFAYFFLKEEVTLFMIGNAALIVAGVYLAESER